MKIPFIAHLILSVDPVDRLPLRPLIPGPRQQVQRRGRGWSGVVIVERFVSLIETCSLLKVNAWPDRIQVDTKSLRAYPTRPRGPWGPAP